MADPASYSGLAAFTEGMQSGLETGYEIGERWQERQQRKAKEELAAGLTELLNGDFSEQPATPATKGAIPSQVASPLQRRGFSGHKFYNTEKRVRETAAKLGDPDAVLALDSKLTDIKKARTLAAVDKMIAAAQFGNMNGVLDSAAEASTYLFPGITPNIRLADTGDALIIENENPDGGEAGFLAMELDPESLMNLRTQMEDPTLYHKMFEQRQQWEQREQRLVEQFREDKRQFDVQEQRLGEYQRSTVDIQRRNAEINARRAEIDELRAKGELTAAKADAELNRALLEQRELANAASRIELERKPLDYGKTMADEALSLLETGGEDAVLGAMQPIFGTQMMGPDGVPQYDRELASLLSAEVGNLAVLNYGTPGEQPSAASYLDIVRELAPLQRRGELELLDWNVAQGWGLVQLPSTGDVLRVPLSPNNMTPIDEAGGTGDVEGAPEGPAPSPNGAIPTE